MFLGVLFYWPLFNILAKGFAGDWTDHLIGVRDLQITWFTVWQALLSMLITVGLAIPSAYVMYRKSFPGQRFLRSLITIPFMLPTIVVATSFTLFRDLSWFEDSPVFWIITAHVFLNFSLAVRTIGSFWMGLDLNVEEAAALDGAGRLRTFWSVSLPSLRPAVISAGASTFLYCTASYGIILVLGGGQVNSLETEIATAANTLLDLPKASALALIQTVLSLIAFGITESGGRSRLGIEGAEHDGLVKPLDGKDRLVAGFVFVFMASVIFAPMSLILIRTFTAGEGFVQNFLNLGGRGTRDLLNLSVIDAMGNSIRNLLIAGTIALVVGVLASYLMARSGNSKVQRFFTRALDIAFLLPLGISTVVLGFGYLVTFGGYPLPLRESWLVVPLIQSVMAVPLVVRLVYPALVSVDRVQLEQASTEGASAWQIWWLVELPAIRFSVYTAGAFAALVSLGEFGAASLLAFGDQATLPTVLYSLISKPGGENYGMAMAASSLIMVLTFAVVFAISRESVRERQPRRGGLV